MELLFGIIKIWLFIGVVPLVWDLSKFDEYSIFTRLILIVSYPLLGPLAFILSIIVNDVDL